MVRMGVGGRVRGGIGDGVLRECSTVCGGVGGGKGRWWWMAAAQRSMRSGQWKGAGVGLGWAEVPR